MSEIKDRARKAIIEIVASALSDNDVKPRAEEILSIKEIAIVDRGATPPPLYAEGIGIMAAKREAQQNMLKAGWVKEVKE